MSKCWGMSREKCSALFLLAGFTVEMMEELPNGYWPDTYTEERTASPWWLVKTEYGLVKLGWRKRVISIHWPDTACRQHVTKDDVTKGEDMVHAWGYPKCLEYLTELRERLRCIRPMTAGADVMTVDEFIAACRQNSLTDDDGSGYLTTVTGKMKGHITNQWILPSRACLVTRPDEYAPFTHVAWFNK